MQTLYMLIGVPGAGKSTWIKNCGIDAVILSTDDKIEAAAAAEGKTYNDMFKSVIGEAEKQMHADAAAAFAADRDVIWDQTNVTAKTRGKKLNRVPERYERVAVYFTTPDNAELSRRLANRPGKTIPYNIVMGMVSQLEMPTVDEGFDRIIIV